MRLLRSKTKYILRTEYDADGVWTKATVDDVLIGTPTSMPLTPFLLRTHGLRNINGTARPSSGFALIAWRFTSNEAPGCV